LTHSKNTKYEDSDSNIDDTDRRILGIVTKDASISSTDLGKKVDLSSTAANDRLRRLKREGFIKNIVAVINPHRFSKDFLSFVRLKIATKNKQGIIELLENITEIEEIHSIAGQFSLMLKVRTVNAQAMEKIFEEIYAIPDIIGSETDIAFRTYVDRPPQLW
jgi:DNA-binding Lrp family transcriptional regulator